MIYYICYPHNLYIFLHILFFMLSKAFETTNILQ